MSLLSSLAPDGVAVADIEDRGQPVPLHPAEAVYVAQAHASRQRDFALGRHCARAALARMDRPDAMIARDVDGKPVWPDGFVGSITHTRGYAAALVAHNSRFAGLGIDAELIGGVTDDLAPRLFDAAECARLAALAQDARAIAATLLFSAKEACYKALFPLTGARFSFRDIHVDLGHVDLGEGLFAVPGLPGWPGPVLGRYGVEADRVLTLVCLSADI